MESPAIPKTVHVKKNLLRNVLLQESLEQSYNRHRENAREQMDLLRKKNDLQYRQLIRKYSTAVKLGTRDLFDIHLLISRELFIQ